MDDIKWTNLRKVLEEFADEVIRKARENLANNGTNASGELSRNMDKEIRIEDDRFQVFLALEDYWKYIEYGTGPSHVKEGVDEFGVVHLDVQHGLERRQQYWPKISAIKEWVSVKPGVPKDDSFAYAVKGKIHNEGIKPNPFLEPAIEYVLPRFEERITEAIEMDVQDYIEGSVEDAMNDALS